MTYVILHSLYRCFVVLDKTRFELCAAAINKINVKIQWFLTPLPMFYVASVIYMFCIPVFIVSYLPSVFIVSYLPL